MYINSFLSSALLLSLFGSCVSVVDISECDKTIGCSTWPEGCSQTSADCLLFSWVYNTAAGNFNMTLSGGSGTTTYVAIAFADAQEMKDGDLYYCTGASLQSAAITTKTRPTDSSNSANGLQNVQATIENGVASCSFTRPISVTKTVSSGPKVFNLTSKTFYFLYARGGVASGAIQYHGFGDANRAFSAAKIDLTAFKSSGAGNADLTLVKVHGALMVLAWLLLSNIGVSIARHFKPLFPEVKPMDIKLWFHLHRTIMVTVLLSTITAFIVIFAHVKGFSENFVSHAIIGIIVTGLAITNPIMALFRPHPNTPTRPIFNWMHYTVGSVARILAIANIFLGVDYFKMQHWVAIMGGCVGWIVLLECILEILSFHYGHTVLGGSRDEPEEKATESDMQVEDGPKPVKGQSVKTTVLIIYFIGLLGFSIAFFVQIA